MSRNRRLTCGEDPPVARGAQQLRHGLRVHVLDVERTRAPSVGVAPVYAG
ncbi:MAG: hypothetical protein ABSB24_05965 [Gaiellaceae bacterium]